MVPIPVLGPDLVDVRQIDVIKREAAKAQVLAEVVVEESDAVETAVN
ncbi:MAG: hypothetical protein M5U34_44450 [Chloroflexi bacterium]|nr:hypothetical protein [Chloroflexota bacterium]